MSILVLVVDSDSVERFNHQLRCDGSVVEFWTLDSETLEV